MSISIRPRPATPLALVEAAVKAGPVGPGAGVLLTEMPLSRYDATGQRSATARMRKAWELGVAVPWIRAAERVITGTFSTVGWHLEDGDDNEIDDSYTNEQAQRARSLIEKPQAKVPVGRKMTRREMWALTGRHVGLCGTTFWYNDQREAYAGTPEANLYIRPDRMTPDEDSSGNLIGWLLDANVVDRPTVKLTLDEVIQFTLDPPDTGHYGIGLVESALLKAQNAGALDRHLGQVLDSGGRLTGIMSPKAGDALNEAQYIQLISDARNITEMQDSAKRVQILRGPVDFVPTAMSLQDMTLVQLLTENRDDLLALWGVPLSQVGGSPPGGLNSGESRKYDYQALIQNAVHPRWVAFAEAIQFQLLDRWTKLGLTLDLVIEEPQFDADLGRFDLAAKTINVPLRNRERRELLGMEPFGGPQDDEVWLPLNVVQAFIAPSDTDIVGTVELEVGHPETGEAAQPSTDAALAAGETSTGKASLHRGHTALRQSLARLRTTITNRSVPKVKDAIAKVLDEQKAEVKQKLRANAGHLLRTPGDSRAFWDKTKWDKRMRDALAAPLSTMAEAVDTHVASALGSPPVKAGPLVAVERVLAKGGTRITGLNDRTRDAVLSTIRPILADAIEQGLGAAATADVLEAALDDITLDNGSPVFDELRAETIARTELAAAYNDATLGSYGDAGITQVEAIDGDQDEECADRNGQVFSIEEADAIEDHPNGTLDWMPVLEDEEPTEGKALIMSKLGISAERLRELVPQGYRTERAVELYLAEREEQATDREREAAAAWAKANADFAANTASVDDRLTAAYDQVSRIAAAALAPRESITIQVPDQPAPIVNVKVEPVVVPAPEVTVNLPPEPKRIIRKVTRDQSDQITGSIEIREE